MQRHATLTIGLLLVMVLAMLAAHPFLTRPGLPRETDAELHVFRAAELGGALRDGAGYVRWAPNFWYGYGYPIFNYYSPLTYYLANAFALLPGLDIVGGTKAILILGLVLAAAGAFSLGRVLFGTRAGLVAAAAYTFSPYLVLIDPHLRGDVPEFFALALFPWLMRMAIANCQLPIVNYQPPIAAASRPPAIQSPIPNLFIAAVLWAALLLTHNLMALIISCILVTSQGRLGTIYFVPRLARDDILRMAYSVLRIPYSLARNLFQGTTRSASHLPLSAIHFPLFTFHFPLSLLLAAGLSAFFWLPFVAERDAVHLSVTGAGHFDFHNHFLTWQTLLAPSQALDLGAAAPRIQHNLGLGQWLLALPAIPLAVVYRRRPQGQALLFFALCSLALIFLMLPASTWIWERVPLMPYIQFPWRLLGPAALALAMCAAGGVWGIAETSSGQGIGRWYPSVCLLVLLGLALPVLYPPMWSPDFGPTTPRGILQVELDGRYLGTTSTGDFVPSTVTAHPPINADLIASYDQGAVDKFDHASLPAGASVRVLEHGPTHDRFAVSSPQAFTARVLTFYFPGWRVLIDGQAAPVRPSTPHGLIEFDVPPGEHELHVTFGSTPPRSLGTLLSLLTLGLLAWWALRSLRAQFTSPPSAPASQASPGRATARGSDPAGFTPPASWLPDLAVVALFIVFKLAVADPCDTCFRYASPPGQVLSAQHALDTPVNFGQHLVLLGYDLPSPQVRSGDKLRLTLYWKASVPIPNNYQVFAHLVRPASTLWGQSDKLNPGDYPTTRWPLDKFVGDDHQLAVLPGTPPGEYQLSVGLYTLSDGARLPVLDAAGQVVGDSFVLPAVVRVLPAPVQASELAMDKMDNVTYNGVVLLGHALESSQVQAPGFVRVTLFWQSSRAAPSQPARVDVALVDERDRVAARIEGEPTGGHYPPVRWQPGQIVRDIYSLWLDAQVQPGVYDVRLSVDGGQALELGTVEIRWSQ